MSETSWKLFPANGSANSRKFYLNILKNLEDLKISENLNKKSQNRSKAREFSGKSQKRSRIS